MDAGFLTGGSRHQSFRGCLHHITFKKNSENPCEIFILTGEEGTQFNY